MCIRDSLMSLRIEQMRNFFKTFFGLPAELSAGFLSNDLSSSKLIVFALTCFVQGNWELRALLLTHLASAGAGVRLARAYAYPLLRATGAEDAAGDAAHLARSGELARDKPPQEPNFTSFARDLFSAEEQGMMPGFQGKDWWAVGSIDADPVKKPRRGDSDGDGDGDGGSAPPPTSGGDGGARGGSATREPAGANAMMSMGGDQGSMAYWSDGSAALVVTSAVRRTGLTADDLYGDGRMKFLPAALLNLAGPLSLIHI